MTSKSAGTPDSEFPADGTVTRQVFIIGEPQRSKVRRNVVVAGSILGFIGFGSTLAANITLNSGTNIEFGQGVQLTSACDEDGFTITPHVEFDNQISAFRLTDLQITGLQLTARGTGWDDADLNGAYPDTPTAKTANPGQFYDTNANEWKRTCDGIVIDFKAYTDNPEFARFTLDNYNTNNPYYDSPLMWTQYNGQDARSMGANNAGFAVKFTIAEDNTNVTAVRAGVNNSNNGTNSGWLDFQGQGPIWIWNDNSVVDLSTPSDSRFQIVFPHQYAPRAEAISQIAVATSDDFSPDYYVQDYYAN